MARDCDDVRACDAEVQLGRLRGLITAHVDRPDGLPGLRLFRTTETGVPTSSIADASVALVVQGAKQIVVGDHVLDYGCGDYLVVSLDLPVTGQFTAASPAAPFLGIGLTLDREVLTALVMDAPPNLVAQSVPVGPALGASRASVDLLDAFVRLLRLLDEPRYRQVLAPMVHREISWRLLCGPQGGLLRALVSNGSKLAQVNMAVQWIRENYVEPFRVEDLARNSAMSTSAFHRHFRVATTMGPINYQKRIRLQQARMRLRASGTDVTGTAHAVGYSSVTQFSREYRREFGVSPSADHP